MVRDARALPALLTLPSCFAIPCMRAICSRSRPGISSRSATAWRSDARSSVRRRQFGLARRRRLPVPSRAGAGNSCPGPAQIPYSGGRVSSELIMIVVELMFAIMLAAAVLIVIPLLLLMAGVAGVVLLWAMAPTAVLVGLVLWLVFPHAMAVAVLVFVLMIGFIVLSRRRQLPMNRW